MGCKAYRVIITDKSSPYYNQTGLMDSRGMITLFNSDISFHQSTYSWDLLDF